MSTKPAKKYPEWAPDILRPPHNIIKFPDDFMPVYDRLLTAPDMKGVWSTLKKRAPHVHTTWPWEKDFMLCVEAHASSASAAGFMLSWEIDFMLCVEAAWRGPPTECNSTPKQYGKRASDLAKAARKLGAGLKDIGFTPNVLDILTAIDPACEKMRTVLVRDDNEQTMFRPFAYDDKTGIIAVLLSLADALDKLKEKPPGYLPARPQSENARIHYFVRALTQYFRQTYKQPLRLSVASTASTAFALGITKEEVTRLAP